MSIYDATVSSLVIFANGCHFMIFLHHDMTQVTLNACTVDRITAKGCDCLAMPMRLTSRNMVGLSAHLFHKALESPLRKKWT